MRWLWILALNLLLAACVAGARSEALPAPLRMLAAGLIVLVIPGLGWIGAFRLRPLSPARAALAVTGISTLATLAALAVTALGPEAPSRGLAVACAAAALNAGLVLAGPPRPLETGARWRLLAIIAAAGFAISSLWATRVVPPLEDHDMELRDTAYGLASTFRSYQLTNRELYIQAAHPILFHFHIAESLLLAGEIDTTRLSYDFARRAERARTAGEAIPWADWWRSAYDALMARPAIVGTRAPSCVLSALTLALLCHLVILLTGSAWAGVAASALYVSFPETLVRSCYAGYFPPTAFVTLIIAALLVERAAPPAKPWAWAWAAAAGGFAALLNHKTVVIVLAVAALSGLDALAAIVRGRTGSPRALWSAIDARVKGLVAGFGAGTLVWWTYGLSVDAGSFVQDHLRKHLVHRALIHDFRLGASPDRYAPGMLDVWVEFNAHSGYLFVPAALIVALTLLARRERGAPWLAPETLMAAWFLTGALLYTLIDWRQTKHFMNQLAPMVAVTVVFVWPLFAPRKGDEGGTRLAATAARALVAAALIVAVVFNLAADARLVRDFKSMTISGASDIDGW